MIVEPAPADNQPSADRSLSPSDTPRSPAPRRRAGRRSLRGIVLVNSARLLILLILLGAGVRFTGLAESCFFYVPSRKAFETPAGVTDLTLTTQDGLRLHAWYLPPVDRTDTDPPAPAVLFCHGNAGTLVHHVRFARFLTERGIGVFMFDYRGYGRSQEGRVVRGNLVIDTETAYAALRQRPDVDATRLGVYGFSLGGAFALDAAAKHPEIKSVCVVAAFSSWGAVAGDRVPVLGPCLVGTGVDGVVDAARLGHRPLLIVHGDMDSIVSPRHATLLERAARAGGADARLMRIPGGDHNRILSEHPDATAAIADFFASTLAVPPGK